VEGRSRLGLLLELPTQRENVELAARAESAGFDSVGAGVPQPLGTSRAVRRPRSRPRRSSSAPRSLWAFARSPLLTAVTALDLDELSGAASRFGLGTGTRRMRTDWLARPANGPRRGARDD
jgi:alkanesulfonate monooxygenase SsuD/methylene tetrahydromethanopterin reductase-like flavin-dependent oxidoreductase (luciferase family)